MCYITCIAQIIVNKYDERELGQSSTVCLKRKHGVFNESASGIYKIINKQIHNKIHHNIRESTEQPSLQTRHDSSTITKSRYITQNTRFYKVLKFKLTAASQESWKNI